MSSKMLSLFSSLVVLLMSSMLGCVGSCDLGLDTCGAHLPGDVIIGVLMPCHAKVVSLNNRTRPDSFTCTSFDLVPFVRSLAIIHTIEEINASGFLPGVRLGYLMCDTCSDAIKSLRNVERMLAVNGSLSILCDYTEFRPPVKAVIGARYSEVSIAVAKLLGAYLIPQLSGSASSPALSDKLRYPSFLRTVPSDVHQTKAITKLMARFKWNWVGVVYGDDDYGRAAFQSFLRDADEMKICTAYQEMVPHNLDHEHSMQRIKQVVEKIRSSGAQVVLLILKGKLVEDLFQFMILNNIKRTWIASDIWSKNRPLAHMDGINQVGDILGFAFVARHKETFDNYLRNMTASPGGYNNFIKQYKSLRFNCTPECFVKEPPSYCPTTDLLEIKSDAACSFTNHLDANDDFLTKALDTSESYNDVVAVWAIAHALKNLLKCNATSCRGEINFQPWKLLAELKRTNFTYHNQRHFFDKNGDFVNGYDMIMWDKNGDRRNFKRIGIYHALDGRIELVGDMSEINWLSTANNLIPESRCSESCRPGFAKKIMNVSCCYDCISCLEGTYSNGFDLNDCQKCPNGTSSEKEWDHCEPIVTTYLRWKDPHPIALVVSAAFGELLLLVILIVFLVHRNSPPMKRAEVRMSCTMISGLAVSFASVICFMDIPNVHLCRARQTMYAMGFTLCVSCILVRAYRTFLAFLPFGQMRHRRLNKLYRPPLIIIMVTAIQGLICILWLVFDSPDVDTTASPQSLEILIQCHVGKTFIGFGVMLGYIALLALVGFLLAFKGRKVPQEFSETGYIIFSMLMYLFVWVCFIPIYILRTEESSAVQASAILVSNYGVIFCHFLPKCYEALFRPQVDRLEKKNLRRWTVMNASPSVPIPNPDLDRDLGNPNTGPPKVSQGTPSSYGSTDLSGYYSATGSLEMLADASPATPVVPIPNPDLEREPDNTNTYLETVSLGTPITSSSTKRSGYHPASVRIGTLGDDSPASSEVSTGIQVRKRRRSISY